MTAMTDVKTKDYRVTIHEVFHHHLDVSASSEEEAYDIARNLLMNESKDKLVNEFDYVLEAVEFTGDWDADPID